jgi:hypothetical protein
VAPLRNEVLGLFPLKEQFFFCQPVAPFSGLLNTRGSGAQGAARKAHSALCCSILNLQANRQLPQKPNVLSLVLSVSPRLIIVDRGTSAAGWTDQKPILEPKSLLGRPTPGVIFLVVEVSVGCGLPSEVGDSVDNLGHLRNGL